MPRRPPRAGQSTAAPLPCSNAPSRRGGDQGTRRIFKRSLEVAHALECNLVRVFTFCASRARHATTLEQITGTCSGWERWPRARACGSGIEKENSCSSVHRGKPSPCPLPARVGLRPDLGPLQCALRATSTPPAAAHSNRFAHASFTSRDGRHPPPESSELPPPAPMPVGWGRRGLAGILCRHPGAADIGYALA